VRRVGYSMAQFIRGKGCAKDKGDKGTGSEWEGSEAKALYHWFVCKATPEEGDALATGHRMSSDRLKKLEGKFGRRVVQQIFARAAQQLYGPRSLQGSIFSNPRLQGRSSNYKLVIALLSITRANSCYNPCNKTCNLAVHPR
jgi:hypothetical protein